MTLGSEKALDCRYSSSHVMQMLYSASRTNQNLRKEIRLCGPSQLLPKCVSVLKLPCTFAIANSLALLLHETGA